MHFKRLISFFAVSLLVLSRMMPAVALPPLPKDPRILSGTLKSGVTYYVIKDETRKGYAEAAIVRRDEILSSSTRKQLDSLPGFIGTSPREFLSRNGMGYGPEGLCYEAEGSTVFRFRDIPVYDTAVQDSTLLLSFSLAGESPSRQAIILAGDVDPSAVIHKMELFSMLVKPSYKSNPEANYIWEPTLVPVFSLFPSPGRRAGVTVTYAFPRTPRESMSTAQPLIMDIFAREFDVILRRRLLRNLREKGVPCAGVDFSYVSSSATSQDEKFSVTVHTDLDHQGEAMSVIATTLSTIETYGVFEDEFLDSRNVIRPAMALKASAAPGSSEFVERCISSFLYGSSLAPFSEELKLFDRKAVSDSVELRLFNNIASALLDQNRNASVQFRSAADSLDDDQALFDYNLAYLIGYTTPSASGYVWSRGDTLALPGPHGRVKISQTRPESVSGGEMWTFSNGMRVVFKNVPGSGMFSYALLVDGGYSSVRGLKEGEAGFFSDMLLLSDISGLSGHEFRNMLRSNGISMRPEVGATDLRIRGEAPSGKIRLLLSSLLALTSSREESPGAFDYYRRSELLRLDGGPEAGDAVLSLLFPGYLLSPVKNPDSLSEDTYRKAWDYFGDVFSRSGSGMLVLSGDLDAVMLKKLLPRYLGGFIGGRSTRQRSYSGELPVAGNTSITAEGGSDALEVMVSAEIPLTAANYHAAPMAVEVIRKAVVSELGPLGVSAAVYWDYSPYPQERLSVRISCRPCPEDGLPLSVRPSSMDAVSTAVARALKGTASIRSIPQADLKAYKAMVLGNVASTLATPEGITETVLARYSGGKDLVSGYKNTVSGIDSGRICLMLKALASGAKAEYIVRKGE